MKVTIGLDSKHPLSKGIEIKTKNNLLRAIETEKMITYRYETNNQSLKLQ